MFTLIYSILLVDTTPPRVHECPSNIQTEIEFGSTGTVVNWIEPMANDASGNVTLLVQTHSPGSLFQVGATKVSYVFRDNADNLAVCTFTVTGVQGRYNKLMKKKQCLLSNYSFLLGFATSCYVIFSLSTVPAMEIFMIT